MADNVTLVTGASGFLGKAVMTLLAEQKQRAIGLIRVHPPRRKWWTISRTGRSS